MNGEGEHERPSADAEQADEEVGDNVFWDGAADEKEESGEKPKEFPCPSGNGGGAAVEAVERSGGG